MATALRRLFRIEYCDKEVAQHLMSIGKEEDSVANPFVHVERNTPDPKKATEFYSKLFQWQLEDVPNPAVRDGAYTMIKVGERNRWRDHETDSGWTCWMAFLCWSRGHSRRNKESGIFRRRGHEGRLRSVGHGLA